MVLVEKPQSKIVPIETSWSTAWEQKSNLMERCNLM